MTREVMQMALNELERFGRGEGGGLPLTVLVEALREALAQPVQPADPYLKRCPGIPAMGCNYTATCNEFCNKCGKVHHLHQLNTPAIAQPVQPNLPPFGDKRKAAMAVYAPPFTYLHGYIYDSQNLMVADGGSVGDPPSVKGAVAARVRGWGRLGYSLNGAELQDEIGQMMVDSLNALYANMAQPVQPAHAPTYSELDRIASDLQALCDQQALRLGALEAQPEQVPTNWSVYNSGAEVAGGLTFTEAWDYLTPERLARQWCAVCVVDETNQPIAKPAQERWSQEDTAYRPSGLAQPEQEPVGWLDSNDQLADFMHKDLKAEHDKRGSSTPRVFYIPVYTSLPQRQPLTEFQRMQIIGQEFPLPLVQSIVIQKIDAVCQAIEAAHDIKAAV